MMNNQFNLTLIIFFLSYALFEPLSNILLKRLRPSVFIPIIMIIWVRVYWSMYNVPIQLMDSSLLFRVPA